MEDDRKRSIDDTPLRKTETLEAEATAFANLALVKYFGKRDVQLNLPAAPSLSITLEPLRTKTAVRFEAERTSDTVMLNGERAKPAFEARVTRFLDLLREAAGVSHGALVATENSFPTAAGLASSASGFAALAVAASHALGLQYSVQALSALARRGSGSAARSIPGGVSVWQAGEREDGTDSFAVRIADPSDLDIRVVVGITDSGPKAVGSTEAMEHTRYTSPYYGEWIAAVQRDIEEAVRAVDDRDTARLGEIAENNALAMHAAILAARPGILFWNGVTVEGLHLVRRLRKEGTLAYFTCDAGPQPKVLCSAADEPRVAAALSELPGIVGTIRCRLGGRAKLVSPGSRV
jgi:diphosphomevalonate decarboxylase